MEKNSFIQKFPAITEQEELSNEIMNAIEAGGCAESCEQGCSKKNLKSGNNNHVKDDFDQALVPMT